MTESMPGDGGTQYYFRGWFIPRAVVLLYEQQEINSAEMVLLSRIDGLQHPTAGGCFASNEYLAKLWGKSPRWVSKTISKLAKLGLIHIAKNKNGSRLLVSRLQPENSPKPPDTNIRKNTRVGGTKVPGGWNKSSTRSNSSNLTQSTGDQSPGGGPGFSSDFAPEELSPDFKPKISPVIKQYARWSQARGYHVISRENGRVRFRKGGGPGGWTGPTLLRWEARHRELVQAGNTPERIQKDVSFFLENYDADYAPTAITFSSFADKWEQIQKFIKREKRRTGELNRYKEEPEEFAGYKIKSKFTKK